MRLLNVLLRVALTFLACTAMVQAGTATWNSSPINNRWNVAGNWTPTTVPNGEDDVATFGVSDVTEPILTAPYQTFSIVDLSDLVFQPGARSYTLLIRPVVGAGSFLTFYGSGIVNNSDIRQRLVAANSGRQVAESGRIYFENTSSAGGNVTITNQGCTSAEVMYGAFTAFDQTSSAGTATFINEGSTASGTIFGGFTNLGDYSSAENATFINNPGRVSGAAAGHTLIQTFPPTGNLGTSTFIANAAKVPGAEGGWAEMDVGTCAGTRFIANGATTAGCQGGQIYAYGAENDTRLGVASYTAHGGNGADAEGGLIDVFHLPLETQTVVKALGGSNGGLGGLLQMEETDDMPVPQFRVFGNGTMDLANVKTSLSIGSVAGDGLVNLAGKSLSIGSNNLSTTFSGIISGQGSVTKEGTGTLAINGINTYSGSTTVNSGVLGGSGTVAGKVTVATNASLAPAAGGNRPATFTSNKSVTFQSGSSYDCLLGGNGRNPRSDQVVAKGITIESGAQFNLSSQLQGQLGAGASVVVLNNTGAIAISGAFANLADGATITVNGTILRASYSGGDGNDLTLTVQ